MRRFSPHKQWLCLHHDALRLIQNAVANVSSAGILLGKGDGSFQAALAYHAGDGSNISIAVADVNGDGKLDLALVGGSTAGAGSVLLGNGDGTFQPPIDYASGGDEATSVAIADVNSDGRPDLVIANDFRNPGFQGGGVAVLRGNGDGTFQSPISYSSGGFYGLSLAVADLNNNGHPDLIVGGCAPGIDNCGPGQVGVLLGKSNGTFQTALAFPSGGFDSRSIVTTDLNGDGKLDVVMTNLCQVSACDGRSPGSVGVLLSNAGPQAVTVAALVSSPDSTAYGQTVTLTATVSSASGTPKGTVIFYDGATSIGSASLGGGTTIFSISTLSVGSHSLVAAYQGSNRFVEFFTAAASSCKLRVADYSHADLVGKSRCGRTDRYLDRHGDRSIRRRNCYRYSDIPRPG